MKTVRLKTDGIVTNFMFGNFETESGSAKVRIDLAMTKEDDDWQMPPVECRLWKSDLERLSRYFGGHIEGLLNGSLCESPVFVPSELGFQIRALDGDVESKLDGYFSIELMINYGSKGKNHHGLYIGYSSTIDLANVNEFRARIENIAFEL